MLLVADRTGRAADAGFLLAAVLLPYMLAGPLVGNGLDHTRRPRRYVVLLAVGYTVAVAVLLAVAGAVPVPLALGVALVVGCTEPIIVALSSLLPRIVPPARLTRAYGLESASYNIAMIAGPGLVAGVAAWADPQVAGLVAVAFAVLGTVIAALPAMFAPLRAVPALPAAERSVPAGGPGAMAARRSRAEVLTGGVVVIFGRPVLRAITVATVLAFVGVGGISVVAVLLATDVGATAADGGKLLVAFAVGALGGSLVSARLMSQRRAEWVVLAGMVVLGGTLVAAAAAPSLLWAVVWFAAAGACDGPMLAASMTLRQRESPAARLGQVHTTGGSFKLGAAAIGAALTGAFADRIGPGGLLLGMAALQFAGALVGFALLLAARKNRSTGKAAGRTV